MTTYKNEAGAGAAAAAAAVDAEIFQFATWVVSAKWVANTADWFGKRGLKALVNCYYSGGDLNDMKK